MLKSLRCSGSKSKVENCEKKGELGGRTYQGIYMCEKKDKHVEIVALIPGKKGSVTRSVGHVDLGPLLNRELRKSSRLESSGDQAR